MNDDNVSYGNELPSSIISKEGIYEGIRKITHNVSIRSLWEDLMGYKGRDGLRKRIEKKSMSIIESMVTTPFDFIYSHICILTGKVDFRVLVYNALYTELWSQTFEAPERVPRSKHEDCK